MENGQLNWVANFIWGIADDVMRDLYVRGKYRDVIFPMLVLRRLDAVLEPAKQAVLEMKERLDAAGVTNQDLALRKELGDELFGDHNVFREKVDASLDKFGMRLSASDRKALLRADILALEKETEGLLEEIIKEKKCAPHFEEEI